MTQDSPAISSAGIAALNDNAEIARYFLGNGNRMAACRAMMDVLAIPYPEWAKRNLQGRAAQHREMVAMLRRDYPDA